MNHISLLLCPPQWCPTQRINSEKGIRQGDPISPYFYLIYTADDSLLFCHATEAECRNLLSILQQYERASGQAVNFQKSTITFSKGVSSEHLGKDRYNTFSYLAQRMHNKMENGYSKLLSPAGKEVLRL